jgi:hypothetical protein
MRQIHFQYYPNKVNTAEPLGFVTLQRFIDSVKQPKPHLIEIFNQIAYFESIGDMESKAKLKQRIYYFTPCVIVNRRRRYSDIAKWTGLAVLDFDHINNAPEFRDYLFNEYKSIICAWLSPSKHGVKALVNIPEVQSVDEFKSYFFGLSEEMWQYNGFDGSGQNCVLPLFQSMDYSLLQRDDFATWHAKGYKLDAMPTTPGQTNPVTPSDHYEKVMIKMIENGIDKITENGHPQLRGLCIAIGGYIANNYISETDALQHIDFRIENNNYLKKGIPGYKKTARWAIQKGRNSPLNLKEA